MDASAAAWIAEVLSHLVDHGRERLRVLRRGRGFSCRSILSITAAGVHNRPSRGSPPRSGLADAGADACCECDILRAPALSDRRPNYIRNIVNHFTQRTANGISTDRTSGTLPVNQSIASLHFKTDLEYAWCRLVLPFNKRNTVQLHFLLRKARGG